MNINDPNRRVRGPPNGSAGQQSRPAPAMRNGGSAPTGAAMSRAEKFEDEKRRIVESCFGKKEPDGSISESYITHIRIVEDAAFPSSPPPTLSPPENKKPRVIVVAVRRSGRVRVHKARENSNGTFSIGKTWNLDDLTKIESYTNSIPTNAEEQQNKERAGGVGFLVTIQKPYYWQASTTKEKDFFIYSMIKIYKKYTGGKLPQLSGFDPQELEQLAGAAGPQPVSQSRIPPTLAPGPEPAAPTQELTRPPENRPQAVAQPSQQSSRDAGLRPSQERASQENFSQERLGQRLPSQEQHSQERLGQRRPSQERLGQRRPSQGQPSQERQPRERAEDRQFHDRQSQERQSQERQPHERPLRTVESDDRIRRMPGQFPSSEFVRNLKPQNSQPQFGSQRSDSPANQSIRTNSSLQSDSMIRPLNGAQSTESFRDGTSVYKQPSPRPSGERIRQNGSYNATSRMEPPTEQRSITPEDRNVPPALRPGRRRASPPPQAPVPERIRPPMLDRGLKSSQRDGVDGPKKFPASNLTPNLPEDHVQVPTLSGHGEGTSNNSASAIDQSLPIVGPSNHLGPQTAVKADIHPNDAVVADGSSSISTVDKSISSIADSTTTASPVPPPEPPAEEEQHRPGLGPMIKKKSNAEIANKFRKAATAYNAFKPRAGSAAEKLQQDKEKAASEADGISGVFPAPSLVRGKTQDMVKTATIDQSDGEQPLPLELKKETPTVQITTSAPESAVPLVPPVPRLETPPLDKPPPIPEKVPDEVRRKRRSDHSAKYAKVLGINPSLLEGRTFDIESVLNDLGWGEERSDRNTFEGLQTGIRKELARVEAGSWLGAIENNDERVASVGEMMDKVVAECEELDGLLTLYNVELGTLSEDVAYIEAQSQGLQVQTANQKLLQTELKTLLDTISISASELRVLKDASLTKPESLQAVETTLAQLYTAMLTIDPRLRQNGTRPNTSEEASVDRRTSSGPRGTELSSMRAIREKKDGYRRESIDFIQRLKHYLSARFQEIEAETAEAIDNRRKSIASNLATKLDYRLREKPKQELWLYSPLMLFAREIEPSEWEDMMRMYENTMKKSYADQFRDNMLAWKRVTRKAAGDEQDVLFTTQEKESESVVTRKLTVKRSKTVRAAGEASRNSSGGKPKDGKVTAYEAFAGALSEMARMIFVEQNFVVDLFHVSSLENSDFIDAIFTAPDRRHGGEPSDKKLFDPDRNMAKKVESVIEDLYSFWPPELQNLVDWVIKQEPLQGVSVLFALESQLSELDETNQEFLIHTLTKIHDRLATLFSRFVEDQIRGIEDTKVKIKKRKGVIAFIKTFPNFSLAIETMLPPSRSLDTLPIRTMVNTAYSSINKAMFESLKFIAKESPTAIAAAGGSQGDPEDKEALNYHILLIENMNHYIEEVVVKGNPVLDEWRARALEEMTEHLDLYLSAVIRRPLGKLLDFIESTESLLRAHADNPTSIATRASHSRSTFKKLLSTHDAKEIRRGIETLKKRVEKHFGDADDLNLSRGLVAKVLRECEIRYLGVGERVGRVVKDVYEGSLEMEWRREDVVAAFKRGM